MEESSLHDMPLWIKKLQSLCRGTGALDQEQTILVRDRCFHYRLRKKCKLLSNGSNESSEANGVHAMKNSCNSIVRSAIMRFGTLGAPFPTDTEKCYSNFILHNNVQGNNCKPEFNGTSAAETYWADQYLDHPNLRLSFPKCADKQKCISPRLEECKMVHDCDKIVDGKHIDGKTGLDSCEKSIGSSIVVRVIENLRTESYLTLLLNEENHDYLKSTDEIRTQNFSDFTGPRNENPFSSIDQKQNSIGSYIKGKNGFLDNPLGNENIPGLLVRILDTNIRKLYRVETLLKHICSLLVYYKIYYLILMFLNPEKEFEKFQSVALTLYYLFYCACQRLEILPSIKTNIENDAESENRSVPQHSLYVPVGTKYLDLTHEVRGELHSLKRNAALEFRNVTNVFERNRKSRTRYQKKSSKSEKRQDETIAKDVDSTEFSGTERHEFGKIKEHRCFLSFLDSRISSVFGLRNSVPNVTPFDHSRNKFQRNSSADSNISFNFMGSFMGKTLKRRGWKFKALQSWNSMNLLNKDLRRKNELLNRKVKIFQQTVNRLLTCEAVDFPYKKPIRLKS